MALVAPQSWSDVDLSRATLDDAGPLLAVCSAIDERVAVSEFFIGGGVGQAAIAGHGWNTGGDRTRPTIRTLEAIRKSIQGLQSVYISNHAPYAHCNYYNWPQSVGPNPLSFENRGLFPWEGACRIPEAPLPGFGFANDSAEYRRFLAWARAALDDLTTLEAVEVQSEGQWITDQTEESLADTHLVLTERGGYPQSGLALKANSNAPTPVVQEISVCSGIRCLNHTPIPVYATVVAKATMRPDQYDVWESNGGDEHGLNERWSKFTHALFFDNLQGSGPVVPVLGGGAGENERTLGSMIYRTINPGESTVFGDGRSGGLQLNGVVWDGLAPDSGGHECYHGWSCGYSVLFDFSASFRFSADPPPQ